MENDALPQYMRIARSIAQRIADGELQEGEKISGRSKLSSEYNVSPETIRKAVQVLQDRAVVTVREQSGVYVHSAEQARQCLGTFKEGGGLIGKKHRLKSLLERQQELSRELQELCGSILDEMILPAQAAQSLPNYCVRIPDDWTGEGKSLGELKFWRATGATVVAIRRAGAEIVSPGPDTAFLRGDLVIFVGDLAAQQAVAHFFTTEKNQRSGGKQPERKEIL